MLFYGFDTATCIELIGEDRNAGRRVYRLTAVRDPSQVPDLSSHLIYPPGESAGILNASDSAHVLELLYESESQQGHTYVVASPGGIRPIPIPPAPPFPAFFHAARGRIPFAEEAERYGKLEIHAKQEVLTEVLQIIDPRLTRIATVVVGGVPILHGDIKIDRLMPLPLLGEGMGRLASLVLLIANAEHGVVLVDEIENGLHYSILTKVWTAIRGVAREFDTQVFATTHSLECINAAHEAFSHGDEYDFRLYRLDRRDSTVDVTTYDKETLAAALEIGLEVR
jgi:AAA domain, putative AbiEii toxin, Type IV TA system